MRKPENSVITSHAPKALQPWLTEACIREVWVGFLRNMVLKREEIEGKRFYARYVLFVLLGVYGAEMLA